MSRYQLPDITALTTPVRSAPAGGESAVRAPVSGAVLPSVHNITGAGPVPHTAGEIGRPLPHLLSAPLGDVALHNPHTSLAGADAYSPLPPAAAVFGPSVMASAIRPLVPPIGRPALGGIPSGFSAAAFPLPVPANPAVAAAASVAGLSLPGGFPAGASAARPVSAPLSGKAPLEVCGPVRVVAGYALNVQLVGDEEAYFNQMYRCHALVLPQVPGAQPVPCVLTVRTLGTRSLGRSTVPLFALYVEQPGSGVRTFQMCSVHALARCFDRPISWASGLVLHVGDVAALGLRQVFPALAQLGPSPSTSASASASALVAAETAATTLTFVEWDAQAATRPMTRMSVAPSSCEFVDESHLTKVFEKRAKQRALMRQEEDRRWFEEQRLLRAAAAATAARPAAASSSSSPSSASASPARAGSEPGPERAAGATGASSGGKRGRDREPAAAAEAAAGTAAAATTPVATDGAGEPAAKRVQSDASDLVG